MSETRPTSEALFARACELMPGGVNSPVRAFKGVGGTPVFVKRASGAHIHDEDGRSYIDFIGSWGPMILGHAHPTVVEAVQEAAASGTSFGCPTRAENEFAEIVIDMVPSVEMVRMVNSGTEATLSAIRVARGFTGRPRLLKFQGCYHGHGDSLLADAGSGVATLGIPGTPGVLPEVAANTITAPFNDLDALDAVFAKHGDELAAVIVEPVAGNMGCITPLPGFLESLRAHCTKHGTVLIFDEVMTGFRVAAGGAQAHYGVTPDMTTLGKVIGGGLPVGAYGGRRDIMEQVAPAGPVYQAGTLSGNPLATAAGIATLTLLRDTPGLYERLDQIAAALSTGIQREADAHGIPLVSEQVGGMYGFYFSGTPVTDYAGAKASDVARYNRFFHLMLDRGCYLAPSAFEASFIGVAHDEEVIAAALAAARESFSILSQA